MIEHEYPVVIQFPIAWGEMDSFQHVNNAMYFRYFESARMAYFQRSAILPDGKLASVGPILASTSCRFKLPLKYPDTIEVGARVSDVQNDRFTMTYAVASQKHQRIAAIGEGLIVSFNYDQGQKTPLPEAWRNAIDELENTVAQGVVR